LADPLRVAVLISGRGSNLARLLVEQTTSRAFEIVGVACNRPGADGLKIARDAGVPTAVVDHRDYAERDAFDQALARVLDGWRPQLVVLAGFMRILGSAFIQRFEGRMVNIHPSLLPRYRGLGTHRRALEAGDREHGASTHFVTADLDSGPVVARARITIESGDSPEALAERLLPREHDLLAWTVDLIARGAVQWRDGHLIHNDAVLDAPLDLDADRR